jgi:hypothetical protein
MFPSNFGEITKAQLQHSWTYSLHEKLKLYSADFLHCQLVPLNQML